MLGPKFQMYPHGEPTIDQIRGGVKPTPPAGRKAVETAERAGSAASGLFSKLWGRVTSPTKERASEGGDDGGDSAQGDPNQPATSAADALRAVSADMASNNTAGEGEGVLAAPSSPEQGKAADAVVTPEAVRAERAADKSEESDGRSAAGACRVVPCLAV